MKKVLLTLLMLFGTISAVFAAEEVMNTSGFWPNNGTYTDTQTSTKTFLGVNWEESGFNNNSNKWELIKCGRKGNESVAYIMSAEAVNDAVAKFVLKISATSNQLNSAKMYVASTKSFVDATIVTYPTPATKGDWVFEVPAAAQANNRFYKFEFNCASGSANGFVQLDKITAETYIVDDPREVVELSFLEEEYSVLINSEFEAPVVVCKPSEAISEIKYSSSNPTVAAVDENTGAVTIVGEGSTTITAYIKDSETYQDAKAEYKLTVNDPSSILLVCSDWGLANAADLTQYEKDVVTYMENPRADDPRSQVCLTLFANF